LTAAKLMPCRKRNVDVLTARVENWRRVVGGLCGWKCLRSSCWLEYFSIRRICQMQDSKTAQKPQGQTA